MKTANAYKKQKHKRDINDNEIFRSFKRTPIIIPNTSKIMKEIIMMIRAGHLCVLAQNDIFFILICIDLLIVTKETGTDMDKKGILIFYFL